MNDTTSVIPVTSDGGTTIPEWVRNELQIDTPGRVRFVETERGAIVIRSVTRPSELRGALASDDEDHEKPATTLLRENRARDEPEAHSGQGE